MRSPVEAPWLDRARRLMIRPCLLFLVWACAMAAPTHAQESWYAAIGGSYVLPVAEGRTDTCDGSFRVGTTQRIGRRIAGPALAVEANTRLGAFATSRPECFFFSPSEPPTDGTLLVEDRPWPFLTTEWFAADLRLRASLPLPGPELSLAVGPGSHWQKPRSNGSSRRRFYWVAGAGVLLGQGSGWRLALEGEWQFLREHYDRTNVTYEGGSVVGVEELGSVQKWLRTAGVTVSARFAW